MFSYYLFSEKGLSVNEYYSLWRTKSKMNIYIVNCIVGTNLQHRMEAIKKGYYIRKFPSVVLHILNFDVHAAKFVNIFPLNM